MSFLPPLLLAAGWDQLLRVLLPFVFLLFWVMGQLREANKKAARGAARMPQPGQPPQPPQPAGVAGGQQADPLRAQVDEFLRRANQQSQPAGKAIGVPPRPPAGGRDEIVVLVDDLPTEPARRPLSEPLRPMSEAATMTPTSRGAEPQQRPPKPRPPRRSAVPGPQSVAQHVSEHVIAATQQIRNEVAQLGERVKQADEQFDVQLQKKFDHQLGSLSDRRAERMQDQQPAAAAVTPAAQIAAMLASPDGVRQAIVVNEILRRPDDRW